ncbi:hypothetical protein FOXG_14796 [Fusarium oxysporum f. sp. lycopersici 4287]|uniref:Carboxylic ester hydrolase n=2 Tax=Fusarium oxysporum TaxID=5507 RepID=A0A0J9VZR2_FUSO4|nr:hypothetical protein FOXG_14796 [Fusarium oxysporum f. sp. lycopersici 4287]KNB16429.1 hypothetical protein FOXG_14796 [Fusarium oxysporum f. sp. lycopersici 4287]
MKLTAFISLWLLTLCYTALAAEVVPRSTFTEVTDYGDNPTGTRMWLYVPKTLAPKPAVVVGIHWCTGSAQAYYQGTRWAFYAETYGYINYYETIKQWTGVFGYSAEPKSTTANVPRSPYTRYVFGDKLQTFLGQGITHNIDVFPEEDLKWFGFTGSPQWGQCGGMGWTGPKQFLAISLSRQILASMAIPSALGPGSGHGHIKKVMAYSIFAWLRYKEDSVDPKTYVKN